MMQIFFHRIRLKLTLTQKDVTDQLRKFSGKLSDSECQTSTKMTKVLNVAEKNDVAKNIAGLLSRGTAKRREGLSKYNKIYEFETALWNRSCTMVVTSVSGHLLGFDFVGAYRKWQGCHPLTLFDAPVVKQCLEENYLKIKKTLEREVRSCSTLIIWTDCDREGENIGYEVIQVCQAVKPNIQIHRAIFSEITSASIHRALQTLGEPNKAVSDAVDVRSELDLRIGAAFTRFQTLRLQKVFPRTLADMLISYGSCQFPTLGFVVERYLAIERFKSEPYWKLKVTDNHDHINVEFRWDRHRLFEKLPCEVLLDVCLENPEATVERVTNKPKCKWRPLPLDTVELEKQGSRKLRMNAKETMQIAERLYTQGFISYPRTETNIFPQELNLRPLVEQQTYHPVWGNFAQRVLTDGITPRQGKKSDQAHPPIHPTKFANTLQGDEARVYEFVVRHFLACLSKNAEGYETTVNIDIAGEKFTTNGLQIIAKNYLDIYIYERWNAKEIHLYEEQQRFRPTEISMVEEKTSPPNLLTEADLIALMDKHGIGTDATHAEHIDTIKSRQYVGLKDNQYFLPGKLGIGLVMGYDSMGFQMSKPNLRAELENDLKLICEGRKRPAEVLRTQIDKYREVFRVALERANLIDASLAQYLDERPSDVPDQRAIEQPPEEVSIFKCPKCGANMVLKERRQGAGKYIGCMGFPTCNNAIWFPGTVTDVEAHPDSCNSCRDFRKLKVKIRSGAIPLLGTNVETCVGCDGMFKEMMGIAEETVRITERQNVPDPRQNQSQNRWNPLSSPPGPLRLLPPPPRPHNAGNRWPDNKRSSHDENSGLNASKRQRPNPPRQPPNNVDNSHLYRCYCHQPVIQLTVRKDGPNKGRLFFKCAKPQGMGCDFFLWNDDESPQQRHPPPLSPAPQSSQMYNRWENNRHDPPIETPQCHCGDPAQKLTVRKEGPTQGRQFWGCPQGPGSSCKFFVWADGDDGGQNNASRRNGGRGGGRGGDTRVTGTKRKCGICGVEGHTRRTCLQNTH